MGDFCYLSIDCSEGYIEEASGGVLEIIRDDKNSESEVTLKHKNGSERQKWVRGNDVGNGWFPLKNASSGKLLTAESNISLTLEGNE